MIDSTNWKHFRSLIHAASLVKRSPLDAQQQILRQAGRVGFPRVLLPYSFTFCGLELGLLPRSSRAGLYPALQFTALDSSIDNIISRTSYLSDSAPPNYIYRDGTSHTHAHIFRQNPQPSSLVRHTIRSSKFGIPLMIPSYHHHEVCRRHCPIATRPNHEQLVESSRIFWAPE